MIWSWPIDGDSVATKSLFDALGQRLRKRENAKRLSQTVQELEPSIEDGAEARWQGSGDRAVGVDRQNQATYVSGRCDRPCGGCGLSV